MSHAEQLKTGERFAFGANWASFLKTISKERIQNACESLEARLGKNTINGKRFLDIGSGSGLFSLAAAQLGAKEIYSIDYDPQSVACTHELKRRFYQKHPHWIIEEASALDEKYLSQLGTFDIVYSWGVLHHTGAMWRALENMIPLLKKEGELFIAIYNDQGVKSKIWKIIKKIYCSNKLGKALMVGIFYPLFVGGFLCLDLAQRHNPLKRYKDYKKNRGMSIFHDWLDWLGGYPFETATPEEVVQFYETRGMKLLNLNSVGRKMGCNEFIFRKI